MTAKGSKARALPHGLEAATRQGEPPWTGLRCGTSGGRVPQAHVEVSKGFAFGGVPASKHGGQSPWPCFR